MKKNLEQQYRLLLDTVAFAARAHHGQLRKDRLTPYVSHVFRVCLVVRDLFGIADHRVLMAALLHDTVEDTLTDFDELEENVDPEVAGWVALLSKDKRQREPEREQAYLDQLARAPWQVQICKLADVFDNLMDLRQLKPERRPAAIQRALSFLEAIQDNLAPEVRRPYALVRQLVEEIQMQCS